MWEGFFMGETKFSLYNDMHSRTNGEIYIGVVGPVRTGKSTFIKGFMEQMVLPNMAGDYKRLQTIDEMPQSAQGRTVMTTEPKFIPKEQVEISLAEDITCRVRLVDCVGFLIPGAMGIMEGEKMRMVKTPWFPQEIPFARAAAVGTRKVIQDHATIGIVVTCDGTFGELDRDAFVEAEEETIGLLQQIGKPHVMVLNSGHPESENTYQLAKSLEKKYHCAVVPLNCQQMQKEDIDEILRRVLYEFPVSQIAFTIPRWVEMLSSDHEIKSGLGEFARGIMEQVTRVRDVLVLDLSSNQPFMAAAELTKVDMATGAVQIRITLEERYYYEYLSQLTGLMITGEYQLLSLIQNLSVLKRSYEKVADAMESVTQKGYGVVTPELTDIIMDEPELIRHGNKFGVKMKAKSPSIHMIRANIETEIAPIVGSEQQAKDLIDYIKAGQDQAQGVFETNIFGKSVGELMEEGMKSKIAAMDDECQMKLQDTMQKIVNDNNGGLICIII
jgi:stage IV sporulation protein A